MGQPDQADHSASRSRDPPMADADPRPESGATTAMAAETTPDTVTESLATRLDAVHLHTQEEQPTASHGIGQSSDEDAGSETETETTPEVDIKIEEKDVARQETIDAIIRSLKEKLNLKVDRLVEAVQASKDESKHVVTLERISLARDRDRENLSGDLDNDSPVDFEKPRHRFAFEASSDSESSRENLAFQGRLTSSDSESGEEDDAEEDDAEEEAEEEAFQGRLTSSDSESSDDDQAFEGRLTPEGPASVSTPASRAEKAKKSTFMRLASALKIRDQAQGDEKKQKPSQPGAGSAVLAWSSTSSHVPPARPPSAAAPSPAQPSGQAPRSAPPAPPPRLSKRSTSIKVAKPVLRKREIHTTEEARPTTVSPPPPPTARPLAPRPPTIPQEPVSAASRSLAFSAFPGQSPSFQPPNSYGAPPTAPPPLGGFPHLPTIPGVGGFGAATMAAPGIDDDFQARLNSLDPSQTAELLRQMANEPPDPFMLAMGPPTGQASLQGGAAMPFGHMFMQEDVQLPAPGSDQFTQGSSPSTTREARSDSYGGTPEGQAFIRAKHEQAWDEAAASDHDGRRKKQKRATADKTVAGGSSKKFACPYFKRNPKKYSKWTSCPGPGWDEVHRVKTHLYRRHALPTQCPRCWQLFKVEDSLSAHLQQNPPCVTRENSTPFEGFTKDQEKKLRSRKKAQADTTDEDKWREIYTILFPDDDPASFPSPYYDTTYYEADETTTSPPRAGDFEDYASFVKREMPTLVRRELEIMFEHEFADIDERVRPRVADVVVRAQTRLLELYRQSQMPLSEYGPSSGGIGGSSSDSSLTPALSHRTSSGTGNADSTPVMDGTVIPPIAAGTGQDPFQFHGSSMPLTFDFDPSALPLGTWDFVGGQQPEEEPEYSTSGGSTGDFSWDAELDKLINPGLFVPQIGEMRNPGAYGVASSGAEVPSQVVPRDGAGWYQYSHT